MKEKEKDNLYITFQQVIESIIIDKYRNPKNEKLLKKFKAKINLGLQMSEEFYFWVNLLADKGDYTLKKGRLDIYDLEIMATPIDLLFFSNGENSVFEMMVKKNEFGFRKLRFSKSSNGKRNLGTLLRFSKIIVLD